MVDYVYFMAAGRVIAQGTPDEIRASHEPFVNQFVTASRDGPVPFHYPAPDYAADLEAGRGLIGRRLACAARLERLGGTVTVAASGGWATPAASSLYLVLHSGTALRRFRLTMREIYFAGVLSLIIILVSGLFVGMVLALQGYETLQRFGASESLGVLVALSLVRELGPVVAGLLFASRAGSAITAEIGLMKATEQLSAMEMMAVDPIARVVAPRFWGGVISMPLLAALFSRHGHLRRLPGRRAADRRRRRRVLVADAGRGRPAQRHPERRHQERGVRRRGHLDRGVRGLRRAADRRGRVARHHAHGGDFVARHPRARLRADGAHVYGR